MSFNIINRIKDISHSQNDNVARFIGLRKVNMPYIFIWILYYAWVIAFATWWTASPNIDNGFGSNIRSLMHIINLLSSAIFIIFIKKEWFVTMARIGGGLIVAGMGVYLLEPSAPIQLICTIIIGISLGCVNTSILMPYVFTLNNTEKLYAVIGSNVLIGFISLFINGKNANNIRSFDSMLLSFIFIIIALSAVMFFKRSVISPDSEEKHMDTPNISSRVYLTLFFNCIIAILCKGVGTGILNITVERVGSYMLVWYNIGSLAGCLIYLALYAYTSKAFILLGNITFAFVSMGLLCNAFISQIPEMSVLFAIFLGVGNTVGMINMYYIIGVVGKKYNSMRYLKLSIIFIGLVGGVSGVLVGNLIHRVNTAEISIIASIISVSAIMLFMILSPLLAQEQYYRDWARDSEMIEIDNEQLYLFKKYQLSKREIEVCKLLLQGYTLRQISAILSISYSTVNTYCTSSYRKLEINSRTELMLLFKDYVVE